MALATRPTTRWMGSSGGTAKAVKLKFKQLVSGERSLNALAEDGSVWVYLGGIKGWKMLNMQEAQEEREQMSPAQVRSRVGTPKGWDGPQDDDIPF